MCEMKNERSIYFMPALLRELQKEFNHNYIQGPGLIRNYEGLPFFIYSNDIDIVSEFQHRNTIDSIFKKVALKLNLECKRYSSMYYTFKYLFSGCNEKLEIDLNFSFNWYGVDFFRIEDLYEYQTIQDGFSIFGTGEQRAFITFCHSFLYGGFINSKYIKLFSNYAHTPVFKWHMFNVFGSDALTLLSYISNCNPDIARQKANRIRLKAILRKIIKNPLTFVKNFTNLFLIH